MASERKSGPMSLLWAIGSTVWLFQAVTTMAIGSGFETSEFREQLLLAVLFMSMSKQHEARDE